MDYTNILKEREITAASRYFGPMEYRPLKSIRPYNTSDTLGADERYRGTEMSKKDEEKIRRGHVKGKISSQGLRNGQMPFLD